MLPKRKYQIPNCLSPGSLVHARGGGVGREHRRLSAQDQGIDECDNGDEVFNLDGAGVAAAHLPNNDPPEHQLCLSARAFLVDGLGVGCDAQVGQQDYDEEKTDQVPTDDKVGVRVIVACEKVQEESVSAEGDVVDELLVSAFLLLLHGFGGEGLCGLLPVVLLEASHEAGFFRAGVA